MITAGLETGKCFAGEAAVADRAVRQAQISVRREPLLLLSIAGNGHKKARRTQRVFQASM